jgi:hypothetical protein
MKFNILKTRNGRLRKKLEDQLLNKTITEKDIDFILDVVSDYEQNNLDAIEKLKKEKINETKRISGALKQTIHAHGPITSAFIGSATKRIYGALLSNEKKESFINKLKKFFTKWIN